LPDDPKPSLSASTTLIVSAFIGKNRVAVGDLPALLSTVSSALANAGGPAPVTPQEPAANLRRLVSAGAILCAECGKRFKSIKRHLASAHNLTSSEYRAKWGLKKGHPMVAPDYSAARSAMAKSIGLGQKGRRRAEAPREPAKAAKATSKPRAARKPKSVPAS